MKTKHPARTYRPCLEDLEARLLMSAGEPSIYDQYMLELINRARANPAAEAAAFGVDLNEGLDGGTIDALAKQPLAFNPDLLEAAHSHETWMLQNGLFQHNEGALTALQRIQQAGYQPDYWAESIGVHQQASGFPDILTWTAQLHEDLFVDANDPERLDRQFMMGESFKEIGVGVLAGATVGGSAIAATDIYAWRDTDSFLTGVVYDDSLALLDGFYTPSEGLGGVTVEAVQSGGGTFTATTWASGGYSLALPAGTYDVTFSGGAVGGEYVAKGVVIGAKNVKIDLDLDDPPPAADLAVAPTPASDRTFYLHTGEAFTLAPLVRNVGTARANGPINVAIYQSQDATVDATDAKIDTYTLGSMTAGASDSTDRALTAPLAAGTYYLCVRADDAETVSESAEANNWGTVLTLVVGESDLWGSLDDLALSPVMVPGDKLKVPLVVTNSGALLAVGTVTTEIYASLGDAPAPGDVLLGTVTKALKLAPGTSATLTFNITIPDTLPQGDWHLLAKVDTTDAIDEGNEGNNVTVTPGTFEQAWVFGAVAGRSNAKLKLHDAAGTLVTFSSRGAGWGEVTLGGNGFDIVMHDSDAKTAVTVATDGARTDIHDITAPGSLGSIAAKADLHGTIDVGGSLGKLTLGDVWDARIELHTDAAVLPASAVQVVLSLGSVRDSAIDAGDLAVKSLATQEWLDDGGAVDTLTGAAVGSLTTRGQKASATRPAMAGDFEPALQVGGAVGKVKLVGTGRGTWNATAITSFQAAAMQDMVLNLSQTVDDKLASLGKLTLAGWMTASRVLAAGNIGAVSVGGMSGCDIFAAVVPQAHGLPDPATAFVGLPQARIASLKVTGKVVDGEAHSLIDSDVAAYSLGAVSVTNALAGNTPPLQWGLAGHTLDKYSYKEPGLSYAWTAGTSPAPLLPGGDFLVRLV